LYKVIVAVRCDPPAPGLAAPPQAAALTATATAVATVINRRPRVAIVLLE
jgi:hypothetical protein